MSSTSPRLVLLARRFHQSQTQITERKGAAGERPTLGLLLAADLLAAHLAQPIPPGRDADLADSATAAQTADRNAAAREARHCLQDRLPSPADHDLTAVL